MSSLGDNIHTPEQNDPGKRGSWRGKGRGRPWRRGRGGKNFSPDTNPDAGPSTENNPASQKPKNPRPTHFLALPLHNHPALSSRIVSFHRALLSAEGTTSDSINLYTSRGKSRMSSLVQGLDSTILIDPIRMHMTLGVMALESEETIGAERASAIPGTKETVPDSGSAPLETESKTAPDHSVPPLPRKTVATALELLRSLQPRVAEILSGDKAVHVSLDHLDVLKTERLRSKKPSNQQGLANSSGIIQEDSLPTGSTDTPTANNGPEEFAEKIGAGVLFLGPSANYHREESGKKLKEICELVNKAFRDAGYLTDARPLKLHCTILNASHRKPRRWQPFSYTDIIQQPACQLLITGMPLSTESSPYVPAPITRQATAVPIQLGTYPVSSIQLWRMGSRGPNNEYVNCGGIDL